MASTSNDGTSHRPGDYKGEQLGTDLELPCPAKRVRYKAVEDISARLDEAGLPKKESVRRWAS